MQAEPVRRKYRWQVWFLVAVLGAMVFGQVMFSVTENMAGSTTFGGDPGVYEASMEQMFTGEVPYLDFTFEHLPLSILPMAVAYLMSLILPIPFAGAFSLVSAAMLYATSELVIRLGRRLDVARIERRWLLLLVPLLPVVLYRVDSLSVLLATAALALAVEGRETGSLLSAIGGILAKGWPVVLAGQDWWRGKRIRAVSLLAGSLALLGLLVLTPGFREGRTFTGVHQETITGSVLVLFRLLTGAAHGLHNAAGAVYVEVGVWAVGLNLLIGLVFALFAWSAIRSPFSWPGAVLLTGALTMALLLASPLLSAQFVLWAMPFVALGGRRPEWLALAVAGALSTLLVGYWLPANAWWHLMLLARNVLLVIAAAGIVATLLTQSRDYASTSLKNLPV